MEKIDGSGLLTYEESIQESLKIVDNVPVYTFYKFQSPPSCHQVKILQTFWNITSVIGTFPDEQWRIRRDMDVFRDILYAAIEKEESYQS
jgi:hypothetical protein